MLSPLYQSGLCPHCGAEVYKCIVQMSGRCPKCGKAVAVNDLLTATPAPGQKPAEEKSAMPGRGE